MQRILALSILTAVAACGTNSPGDADDGDGYGEGLGTPENPVPQSADKGPYAVASRVDFTVEAILPPQAELVVETLRAFHDNPARTLVTVADEAGVPAVKTFYDAIPGIIKDHIEGWINDEINKIKINGMTLPDYAGQMAALAETALTQFELDSSLAIMPGTATHTLQAIDFSPAGIDVKLPIPGLAMDVLTQHPTVHVGLSGALSLGDQHFGLEYGEYAWLGINLASTAVFGGDIRSTMGKAVNCPALAHTISSKCVLGVCVGHESEVKAICEGGLDAIVNTVHDRFAAMRADVFRFISGTGHLVDDDQDGVADRIEQGAWDSEMNLGMGLRKAPATFTATR